MSTLIIHTKYINPTDKHGSRVKAILHGNGESITIPYRSNMQPSDAHLEAVKALVNKLKLEDYPESQWRYGSFTKGYIWFNLARQE